MNNAISKTRRICLDARLLRGVAGGVEQAVIGLGYGLSQLTDGDEEYLFLTYQGADEWLRPYLSGPCRILSGPPAPQPPSWIKWLRPVQPLLRSLYHQWSPLLGRWTIRIAHSDGTAEKSGAALIHFTHQHAFLTHLPSIFQPWDLQHLHLPHFFSPRQRLAREQTYRLFCQRAEIVVVASFWARHDLIRRYGLSETRVKVISPVPVLHAYRSPTANDLRRTRTKFDLPDSFIFYPAQTWAHKNHIGLLKALAILRDRHKLVVPLVCSGQLYEPFFPTLLRATKSLDLHAQVKFLGFVDEIELQCLYKMCTALIFPSKFEGSGMPVMEAFVAQAPVACANVTSLPEQAGDAALLFDPEDPEAIAEAIRCLWQDEALRQRLIERGRQQALAYSWEQTARIYRAHYRRVAGWPLTAEDQALLEVQQLASPGGQ